MSCTYELNRLACANKRAHVKLKSGFEFDCTPDCLSYDKDGNELMLLEADFGSELYGNEDIESVIEIE